MSRIPLEKRVDRSYRKAINHAENSQNPNVNWNYIQFVQKLESRGTACCSRAKELIVDHLVKDKLFTRDRAKGWGIYRLGDMYDEVIVGAYFASNDSATAYAHFCYGKDLTGAIICPMR